MIPQRITVYEYDITKANYPNATAYDLIKKVKTYPDDFGMSSLRPNDLAAFVSRIQSNETVAI